MGDQSLLVLHIVRVKNWYAIFMEKNKTTQRKLVSNLQKSMRPKIQILSYSNAKLFGMKSKKLNEEKDALLAREFEIAFPSELNAEQRKNMLDELCQNLVKNMVS